MVFLQIETTKSLRIPLRIQNMVLHSQGFSTTLSAERDGAAAFVLMRLSREQETASEANAQRPEALQQNAQAVAATVDRTMEILSLEDDAARGEEYKARKHLVCRVGSDLFAKLRDGKMTVGSRPLRGSAALVQIGDLLGFVSEFGGPVLWMEVTSRDYHFSHVRATRDRHGEALFPGASEMSDEALDHAFWHLHEHPSYSY